MERNITARRDNDAGVVIDDVMIFVFDLIVVATAAVCAKNERA